MSPITFRVGLRPKSQVIQARRVVFYLQSAGLRYQARMSRNFHSASRNMDEILPPGSWDSHLHVLDEEKFPFSPNHGYRPKKADLNDLYDFENKLGKDINVCFVAASVYGTDNSIILDALSKVKGRGRAVVTIDPATVTDEELDHMHELGVRGTRINLKSVNANPTKEELSARLFAHADRVRSRGWAVQIYLELKQLVLIAPIIPKLGVKVVIDHMGQPDPSLPASEQAGYTEMLELLKKSLIWVKISGEYRFPRLPDLDEYGRALIQMNPAQVVWASDWPHTGGVEMNPNGDRKAIQDFRKVDPRGFIARCKEWCDGDASRIQALFKESPRRLWTT